MFVNLKIAKTFALAAAIVLPAAAQAEEYAFQHEGISYVYNATADKDRTVITGTADKVPFRLVVRGRSVSGTFNRNPVQFSLRDVESLAPTVAVAAR